MERGIVVAAQGTSEAIRAATGTKSTTTIEATASTVIAAMIGGMVQAIATTITIVIIAVTVAVVMSEMARTHDTVRHATTTPVQGKCDV